MVHNAARERVHDLAAILRNAPSAVEWKVAVVRAIAVPHGDAGGVESGVTVEALVPGKHSQHATRPMLTWYICDKE